MKSTHWLTTRRFLLGLIGIAALVLASCAKDATSKEPDDKTPATAVTPAGIGDPGPQGIAKVRTLTSNVPNGGDTSYNLMLDVPPNVKSGSEGVVAVTVVPTKGWKMNKEFPTRLKVTPPAGVSVDKNQQSIDDAAFAEKKLEFKVKFKADSTGAKNFAADFRFAVCTDATCDPKRQKLAWVVNVE